MSATLELRGVAKSFGAARALDGIDLTVAAGQFLCVIGSNGAGKSSLLRMVSGLLAPDAGSVWLDGQDITASPPHRRAALIGRIAQDPQESSCAGMTIAENLAMAAMRGRTRLLCRAVTAARRAAFRDLLAPIGLGLEDRLDVRMGTLSGGQRQAVALVMATLAHPPVLLLDEHLAALDPRTAELVMALTGRLVAEIRPTTLMVTHDMRAAIAWGDRLVMMHAGRIILDVAGAEKSGLTVPALVARFHVAAGVELADDRVMLG